VGSGNKLQMLNQLALVLYTLATCFDNNVTSLSEYLLSFLVARDGAVVEALRYKPEGRGIDSPIVSLGFFINIILPATLRPLGRISL
jgi:hypothetical protein